MLSLVQSISRDSRPVPIGHAAVSGQLSPAETNSFRVDLGMSLRVAMPAPDANAPPPEGRITHPADNTGGRWGVSTQAVVSCLQMLGTVMKIMLKGERDHLCDATADVVFGRVFSVVF